MTTRPESFVTFPGDLGVFHERTFLNRLDANTGNLVQDIGSWRLESGGDWLASPIIVSDPDGFGGKALETVCTATPNQPRLSTGTPGGVLYAVNPSTEYSASYPAKVDRAGNTAFCSLDWYDSGEGFISRDESAGVPLTPNVVADVGVTATSPATAAFCRIRTRLTPAAADTVHRIGAAIIRDGPSQLWVPSIIITDDLELVADIAPASWAPASVQEVIARWGAPGGLSAYMLRIQTDGTLALIVNVGGTQVLSSIAHGKSDGERGRVRVTRAHLTGDVNFELDGAALGGTVSGPSGKIDEAGGANLVVAGQSDGTGFNPFEGVVFDVGVFDGISGGEAAAWVPDEILGGSV